MIVRLSGGLGNQMFQYAFGRAISLQKHELFWIDDAAFSRDSQREYALQFYNIKANRLTGIIRWYYNFIYYLNRKIKFIQRGEEKLGFFYERDDYCYDDVIDLKAKYYEGWWQNTRYFDNIRSLLQQELSYRGEMTELLKKQKDEIQNHVSVAVHVRRGDYLSQKNQNIYEVLDIGYYHYAMKYLEEIFPQCIFFFFSDDMEWCKSQFGKKQNCIFFEEKGRNNAQEDIYLMQHCDHFIIANSSFSWWAAWLGKKEQSICIAPKRWYKIAKLNPKVEEALLKDFVIVEN